MHEALVEAERVVERWKERAGVDGVDSVAINWRDLLILEIAEALMDW